MFIFFNGIINGNASLKLTSQPLMIIQSCPVIVSFQHYMEKRSGICSGTLGFLFDCRHEGESSSWKRAS